MESAEASAGAEQTTETETQSTEETQQPGLKDLGELLQQSEEVSNDEQAGDESEKPGGDESGDESKAPTKFNDLAGKLGVELDDLYALEITSADGAEPVTIEALKDMHAKQIDLDMRELQFEESRAESEQKLMQAQNELRELMAALPEKAIKPEVLEKIRKKHDQQVTIERQRTLDVIPEWKDAKRREADITGMAEHLQGYGYPVNYLQNVVDHKQLKYIRDNWQREQRIKKALAAVKAGKPNTKPAAKTSKKAPVKQPLAGVKKGQARNKLEAVFSEVD